MVFLIKSSPLQAAHFAFSISKNTGNPVYYAVEVGFNFVDIFIVAVAAHVVANVALTYPIQCAVPEVLTVGCAFYICTPLLNVCVLAVAELLFTKRYKWT